MTSLLSTISCGWYFSPKILHFELVIRPGPQSYSQTLRETGLSKETTDSGSADYLACVFVTADKTTGLFLCVLGHLLFCCCRDTVQTRQRRWGHVIRSAPAVIALWHRATAPPLLPTCSFVWDRLTALMDFLSAGCFFARIVWKEFFVQSQQWCTIFVFQCCSCRFHVNADVWGLYEGAVQCNAKSIMAFWSPTELVMYQHCVCLCLCGQPCTWDSELAIKFVCALSEIQFCSGWSQDAVIQISWWWEKICRRKVEPRFLIVIEMWWGFIIADVWPDLPCWWR